MLSKRKDDDVDSIINLAGKRILITGASSGIGKDTAIMLSAQGAECILVARREDKLQEVLSMLACIGEVKHSYYCFDLCKTDEIEEVVKKIVTEQGKLDGMVYAAGVGTSAPFIQFTPEKVRKVFDINFFGFVELARQICKKGRFHEEMRIVGISSVAATRGDKSHMAYSASKAAMDGAVRCIAKEVAEKGICINTVAPAMTATDMYKHYLEKYGEESGSNQELLKRQYLGIAETFDVANAVAYLLSPAARFITGISLPVDGGMTTS